MSVRFDIQKENELIAAGTHFWCKACVTAQDLFEQSENKAYCKSCWQTIKAEREISRQRRVKRRDVLILAVQDGQGSPLGSKDMKSIKVARK